MQSIQVTRVPAARAIGSDGDAFIEKFITFNEWRGKREVPAPHPCEGWRVPAFKSLAEREGDEE